MSERGKLWVQWDHAHECPARAIGVLDPRWREQPQLCRCGMPDWFDLHVTEEIARESLDRAIKHGDVVIPGGR